jgi:predicted aldo/keto reductase-like oxidoreductase
MSIQRRTFLGGALSGAGALAVGRIPEANGRTEAEKSTPLSTDPVAKVALTDEIHCSRIGMGCGMKGWERQSNLTRMEHPDAIGLIRYCYDQGVRLFDMADLYGAHPLIAEALKDKPRDSYTLISKIWYMPRGLPEDDRPDADVVIKRFLKECRTDYLDLVQIHCQSKADWTETYQDQMEIMEKCKQEGLIRGHGVSCHGNPALDMAAESPWVDALHVRINPQGARMDGGPEEVVPRIEKAKSNGKGVIGMKVIGEGAFGPEPEMMKKSIRYVTQLSCVDAMIVGFEAIHQIDFMKTNVAAALEEMADGEAIA